MPLQATIAEINLTVFENNIKKIKNIAKAVRTVLVVKANAYGHGIVPMSFAGLRAGVDALGVATVNEGVTLRENGVTAPILVLFQHSISESELVCYYNLTPIVSNNSSLPYYQNYCKRMNKKMNIYVKVDTGLSRMGVRSEEVLGFAKDILSHDCLSIHGITTHFAASDGRDEEAIEYTKNQIRLFNCAIDSLKSNNIDIKDIQAANSAATLFLPEAYFNTVRFGLAAYGYIPEDLENPSLEPVMSFKSKVLVTKSIKKGDSVSYSMTYKASKDTRIAVVPVGYSDGLPRAFSNKGKVKIKDKYYPIVGRICMDSTIIDIGSDNINLEDEVLIFGNDEILNAQTLAEQLDTIPHEIIAGIGARVHRVYIK